MAEILVLPDKLIQIDDEDFEKISVYQWRTLDNVSGRVGRRLENGRIIGLAATLVGKRPGAAMRISFRDKNPRNFSKSNIHWNNDCIYCGRPMKWIVGTCRYCRTDFDLNRSCRSPRSALAFCQPYFKQGSVDG